MTKETTHLPESPNVNRSWRRISTGKLNILYIEEKILPNYLRSPTGSCHNGCKYGRKHESEDKPRVSPLKRINRSYTGTLNLDSPLRKKAATKSVLKPSLGCEKYDSVAGSDHANTEVRNFFSRVCDVNKKNADGAKEKAVLSFLDSRLGDSTKPKKKKKTVSKSFKLIGMTRSRSKAMVEHNKRVTALKLKSVAQSAAMALRRSTVNRKNVKKGYKAAKLKEAIVPLRASMSSKRCYRILKTKKESNNMSVTLTKSRKLENEKCKGLVEEKTLYITEMKTGNDIVGSDQNQRSFMDSSDEPMSAKNQDEAKCIFTEVDNESSQEEEEEDENVCFSEDKSTTRQGNNITLSTDSAVNSKSMKLRFRRVKTVDFGSQDNTSRKAQFKRGKIVSRVDTTLKSGSPRSLKTKGTNFSNHKEQQHKPKVVMEHQDTQKERDSKVVLFNNVIEETSNKVVETRTSKVKALVNVFESVISLQVQKRKTYATT